MALWAKSSTASCAGIKSVLNHTLAGSCCGRGQSVRNGVQQAGRAGSRFMAGIVQGLGPAVQLFRVCSGRTTYCVWLGCRGHTSFETRILLGRAR